LTGKEGLLNLLQILQGSALANGLIKFADLYCRILSRRYADMSLVFMTRSATTLAENVIMVISTSDWEKDVRRYEVLLPNPNPGIASCSW